MWRMVKTSAGIVLYLKFFPRVIQPKAGHSFYGGFGYFTLH